MTLHHLIRCNAHFSGYVPQSVYSHIDSKIRFEIAAQFGLTRHNLVHLYKCIVPLLYFEEVDERATDPDVRALFPAMRCHVKRVSVPVIVTVRACASVNPALKRSHFNVRRAAATDLVFHPLPQATVAAVGRGARTPSR